MQHREQREWLNRLMFFEEPSVTSAFHATQNTHQSALQHQRNTNSIFLNACEKTTLIFSKKKKKT